MILRPIKCLAAGLLWLSLAAVAAAQPVDRVVAAHYPPLMINGDADHPGYAIEILKEAARRSGREMEITFLPFARAVFAVQNDPATLMPALFKGKERDDLFNWVFEYDQAELRFASRSTAVNDLDHARALGMIVVEQGTTGDVFLTRLGFSNVLRLQDPQASARMLQSGRADAWLLAQSNMQMVWEALGFLPDPIYGDVVHSVAISVVASPSTPKDTIEIYRNALLEMDADGTLDAIKQSYKDR